LDTIDYIKEIETSYDVKSIKVDDIEVWPFLRSIYLSLFEMRKFELNQYDLIASNIKISKLKNSFYGFRNLFRKYDYLVFANTGELRLKNDVYVHRLTDILFDLLGKENTLLVEYPANSRHHSISELSMKNIISLYLFTLVSFFNPFHHKISVINEDILKEINKKYNLNIDYKQKIEKFISYRNLFIIFFKINKPKLIFISVYYNLVNQAVIHAARTLDIKTIELQHGVINQKHAAYNVYASIDNKFFPEYLFVFGNNIKKIFNQNNYFIGKKNVFSIGNMYIDYINNEYELSPKLKNDFYEYRKIYKKIVAIASQPTIEVELIEFLKKVSTLSEDTLFIFVPRDMAKDYTFVSFPENIIILKSLDLYQTIKYSDFHSTVNSTSAIEAPALGTPNILINIKNESKKYYSDILNNLDVTRFVDTPEEFVKVIHTWTSKPKEEIKQLHEGFYAKNHKNSLRKALDKIMNDRNL